MSVRTALAFFMHGLYTIGNVKTAHAYMVKEWLLSQVPYRGDRATATTTISVAGQEVSLLAAADMDKQPMVLLGTAGTSSEGEPRQRRVPIKKRTVKPTLYLKNVPIWDSTISTRDNAQAIKIALGSAGYLDTTKGKGTRQEQMILLAALRHATAHYPMALAIVNIISMDPKNCGYIAWKALLTELHGSAMGERKRLEEEITTGQLPNESVQVYVRRY
eukprot:jgi/Tetstr1/457384/TSEL_043986.t1